MKKILLSLFVMFALFEVAVSPAMARGTRVDLGAFGIHKEAIVKVLDLPDTATFQRSEEQYVDLGYLHRAFGEGQWIGYIGSAIEYLPLNEEQLAIVLAGAEISELPPVPAMPVSVQIAQWIVYSGMAVFGLLVVIMGFGKFRPHAPAETAPISAGRARGMKKTGPQKGFGRRP